MTKNKLMFVNVILLVFFLTLLIIGIITKQLYMFVIALPFSIILIITSFKLKIIEEKENNNGK